MKSSCIPRIILIISGVSLIYWIYLGLTTHMSIECDAIGYEQLGRSLQNHGLMNYFKEGPQREPIYPLLVSLAMKFGAITDITYTKIMAFLGVLILLFSQSLTYLILRQLNVRLCIIVPILIYFGLSPAINNTAFSLYSEIAAIPIVLILVLIASYSYAMIKEGTRLQNLLSGSSLGIIFVMITLIKSIFEATFFIFLMIFSILIFKALLSKNRKLLLNLSIFFFAFLACYEIPIVTYKMLNKIHNGHYALTNRASWALYGSCALKTEPLPIHRLQTAFAHIPGKGACAKFFSEEDCSYWEPNFTSDALGQAKAKEIALTHTFEDADRIILKDSQDRILSHPFQFILLSSFDWIKMFFWESTKIGFVSYPEWLEKLYNASLFKDALRLFISLISLSAFLFLLFKYFSKPFLIFDLKASHSEEFLVFFFITTVVLAHTIFHALFNTVPRWALPIAPLYLICIGYCFELFVRKSQNKKQS